MNVLPHEQSLWNISPVYAGTAILIASVVVTLLSRSRRGSPSGEPPLVPYFIPWVGSVIDMGKDPDAFFSSAMYVHYLCVWIYLKLVLRTRFGYVFRVKTFGKEMVYVTSPTVSDASSRDDQA
jgi:hypothetical protein